MTRVLVVEDEDSYREALAYMLGKEGFEVVQAADGSTGLAEFDRVGADIVLLDLMMPGLTGTEVCRQLRQRGPVPVIMVTARDSEVDKVVGLELGADDYVTKPFSHRELVARIRAVLRRGQDTELVPDVIEADGVRMDVERHEVSVDGRRVQLALKEFELLEMLLRNAGRVMTRGQLIDRIWGADYVGDTKTLDVHIKRLRTKIEEDPGEPEAPDHRAWTGLQVRRLTGERRLVGAREPIGRSWHRRRPLAVTPLECASDRRDHRLLRFGPSRVRRGDVSHPRGGAESLPDHAVQQRLPPGPAPRQLPSARRLHRPDAGPAGAGQPVRAAC